MISTIKELRNRDILTYRSKKIHAVNNYKRYASFYNDNLRHKTDSSLDIMKVQRYKKILFFYILKTIYKR